MLGVVKLQVLLGSMQATIKYIARETLHASTIIWADLRDQYVMAIQPE